MIAYALLDSCDNSLLLGGIYQYIMDKYPYYKHTTHSWRTSIRHNLSVNECFVKGKRSKNGRGYFWSIHSSCLDSFKNGDFDRRKARRQVQHCNRAFSSAFSELGKLISCTPRTQSHVSITTHPHTMTSQLYPMAGHSQYQQHNVGGTGYMAPVSSTPVRNAPYPQHYAYYHGYNQGYYGYQ